MGALGKTPKAEDGNLEEALKYSHLGTSLWQQFQNSSKLEDLEDAISQTRRAVDLTLEGHPDMPTRLSNLAAFLQTRSERLGELDDLDTAISAQRRIVDTIPESHPGIPIWFNNLSHSLKFRFERLGELQDLDGAISAQQRAAELAPGDHADVPLWLMRLGSCFESRFQRLGELHDLESAISAYRRAVDITPDGHPDIPSWVNNLGLSLHTRFRRLGELTDLQSAISAQGRALALTPDGDPKLSVMLNNLAMSLMRRYERFGQLDDIQISVAAFCRAVNLTPEGNPNKPTFFNNLGQSLQARFDRLGDLDDLESAISVQRRTVDLVSERHSGMPVWLNNLGRSLHLRFLHFGELADLEGAIATMRRAVDLTLEGHPGLPLWLNNLGELMRARFEQAQSKQNYDAAVECFAAATHQAAGPSSSQLKSAKNWMMLESAHPQFGSPESLLRAHSRIVEGIPEIVWLGHTITRRYQESADVADLVNGAVAAAITLHDLSRAIEWLEAGRGLIWSQVLSLRTPVSDLAQHHAELADRLHVLSKELQHAHLIHSSTSGHDTHSYFGEDTDTNKHRKLVLDYERCLKEIRACPGFESFLRPQKLESLTSLVKQIDGHIVFINVSSSRCDALVVSRGGTVELVPLLELKLGRANKLRDVCTNYLQANNVRKRGTVSRNAGMANGFSRLLDRIWKWIVRPILEALGFTNDNRKRLPHITWCPTGPLTQLPLHAAGLYPESGPPGPHVFDFVVSSYTPSLSALSRAQNSRQPSVPSVLIVTQPATPDLPALPGVTQEGEKLREILSKSQIRSEAFNDAQATVESIESVIGQFPWVHFACHGVQDLDDPTQSAFMLHDGKLTLSTLMETVAEGAELAFLSACQTATGDEKVPEEAAHLAAGMLAVGFKGVVATMWSIEDADAPVIVEVYYRKLLELCSTGVVTNGSTCAAYALHEAVKCLREKVGERNFVRWVAFVHYGV